MTEDSKKVLLQYLTGTIQETPQSEMELTENEIVNNLDDFLSSYQYCQFVNAIHNENFSEHIINAIYTNDSWTTTYGLLIICDENMNPIQKIEEYPSGEKLNRFVALKYDEDNNIYGIDYTQDGKYRFVMLNNPLAKKTGNYILKIRYSLFINEPDLYFIDAVFANTHCEIQKVIGSPFYIMAFGKGVVGNMKLCVITLKIQVGESPEWNTYLTNNDYPLIHCPKVYYEYSNDNLTTLNVYFTENQNCYRSDLENDAMTNAFLLTNLEYCCDIENITKTELFVLTQNKLLKINNANTNNPEIITLQELGMLTVGELIRINQLVAIGYIDDSSGFNEYHCGVVTLLGIPYIANIGRRNYGKFLLTVSNSYNLYKVFFQVDNNVCVCERCVYAETLYNGNDYTNYLSLYPMTARLYSNGYCEFARNLYNKVQTGNKFTSTVEIPFTLLNIITIDQSDLLSLTNKVQVSHNENISKNIFENVFLNFTNQITMLNEKTGEYNNNGAIRLINSSMNTWMPDYDESKIKKYKINYQDGTSKIGTIGETEYVNNKVKVVFDIFVPRIIQSIDLMSYDMETIYNTITLLDSGNINDLQPGKYYKITQWVEVR